MADLALAFGDAAILRKGQKFTPEYRRQINWPFAQIAGNERLERKVPCLQSGFSALLIRRI